MLAKFLRPDRTEIEAIYSLRRTFYVYAVIFILWGLYRLLLRLPLFLEEVFIKPLVLLPPVLSVLEQERHHRESILALFLFRRKNLLLSLYFGLTLGVSYFLAVGLGSLVFSTKEVFSVLQFTFT